MNRFLLLLAITVVAFSCDKEEEDFDPYGGMQFYKLDSVAVYETTETGFTVTKSDYSQNVNNYIGLNNGTVYNLDATGGRLNFSTMYRYYFDNVNYWKDNQSEYDHYTKIFKREFFKFSREDGHLSIPFQRMQYLNGKDHFVRITKRDDDAIVISIKSQCYGIKYRIDIEHIYKPCEI